MGFSFWNRGGTPATHESRAAVDPAPKQSASAPAEMRSRPVDLIKQSGTSFAQIVGLSDSMTDEVINIDTALKVPAFGAGVTFLAQTLAALPLKVWANGKDGREPKGDDPVAQLLNGAANDELNAYEWRKAFWVDVFTHGRAITFIERNGRGEVINLWPLDVTAVTVQRYNGRKRYLYRDGRRTLTYGADEVLDVCFLARNGGLGSFSPVYQNADTIGLARAATRYGAKVFNRGGVPAFVISGPFTTPGSVERATEDMSGAVEDAAANNRPGIAVPDGHTVTPLGFDPEKMQMTDTRRFLIEEFARIFGLPKAFLADLTHGTFSNVEQQDLQLVKHAITHWATALEKEINLKIFGRKSSDRFAEHVLEGLLRGDFKTRSEGHAKSINSGQATPNEIRKIENRPPLPGGDVLLVQGAMVPAESFITKGKGADDK